MQLDGIVAQVVPSARESLVVPDNVASLAVADTLANDVLVCASHQPVSSVTVLG